MNKQCKQASCATPEHHATARARATTSCRRLPSPPLLSRPGRFRGQKEGRDKRFCCTVPPPLYLGRPGRPVRAAELRRPSIPFRSTHWHRWARNRVPGRPMQFSLGPDLRPAVPDSSYAARGKTEPAVRAANCFILSLSVDRKSADRDGDCCRLTAAMV
jgi:hypothetical protein